MPATEQDRITYIENEMVELRADIAATNKGISDLGKTVTELASVVRVTHAEHQGAREMLKQELAAHREALNKQELENHDRPRQTREAIYWAVGSMLALLGMLGPWVFFTMTKPGEIRDEQHAAEAAHETREEAAAAVAAVRSAWGPFVLACQLVADAQNAWADALALSVARGGRFELRDALPFIAPAVRLWDDLVALRPPGITLPTVDPAVLSALATLAPTEGAE